MVYFVSPQLYRQYKDAVLELSLAVQEYTGTVQNTKTRCLSDRQIAERLRLEERDVAEIRCIAETDVLTLGDYAEAERFKQERCGNPARRRSRRRGAGPVR